MSSLAGDFRVFASDTVMDAIDAIRRRDESSRTAEEQAVLAFADAHRFQRYSRYAWPSNRSEEAQRFYRRLDDRLPR